MSTSVVSAGTLRSCECCQEPFGRLEALRTPIPLGCRHVICIGCLRDDESLCPICGVAYDKTQFQTMFDLVAASPHYTPLPLEAEDTARVLRNRCLALGETTPLSILREVLRACNSFLKDQPRNKFTELENSARFLGYQIKAEETIEAMAFSMESLAGTVQHLNQRLEKEKEGRANDRAIFDQQLNEANTQGLELLARIARLETEEDVTSDHAIFAEQPPMPVQLGASPSIGLEVPPASVHSSEMSPHFDDISRPLSPLPISSNFQGFGALSSVPTGDNHRDELTLPGHLISSGDHRIPEVSDSSSTGSIMQYPSSLTALFHGLEHPNQSLAPMISVVPASRSESDEED